MEASSLVTNIIIYSKRSVIAFVCNDPRLCKRDVTYNFEFETYFDC